MVAVRNDAVRVWEENQVGLTEGTEDGAVRPLDNDDTRLGKSSDDSKVDEPSLLTICQED